MLHLITGIPGRLVQASIHTCTSIHTYLYIYLGGLQADLNGGVEAGWGRGGGGGSPPSEKTV